MGTRMASALAYASEEQYMPRMGDDELKKLIKEAIHEWMNQQFAAFGRWSFYGIAVAALGALAVAVLTNGGWRH